MDLCWHRRDLRVTDNRMLAGRNALPVFVLDEAVLEHAAPPRVAFMLDALESLREAYRERGGNLLIERGDPSAVVPTLAAEFGVDTVVWNHDYSGLARERDEAVRAALDERGINHEQYHDAVIHEPGSITTTDGDPYSVFTYFGKKWLDRDKPDPVSAPESVSDPDDPGGIPALSDLGFEAPEGSVPDAGPDAAENRLETFCDGPIRRYEEDRDYPSRGGTSRLSVDLKFGTVGIRRVYAATENAKAEAGSKEERGSVEEFQSQLAWREFYTQVLYYHPNVVTKNYKTYDGEIEWRTDEEGFDAWTEGKTGYPIVDAGMRQLREESWMHNRVRMLVAAFLTKDLLVDWREGYDWFRKHLVDHDTGNDTGGWQWAASTGTDAQPYFRIFNPMTQGERYDPDAEYIREYVPELREVDPKTIHAWHDLDDEARPDVGYPAPIVDHAIRREVAIETFERARGEE
ncbi:cryptochrome/photolyase family protein [Halalkalicoccus jeotgali]|uniref:Deoxyribodipyrimidine photo-lyase n=1 Tax=Halalkalicoccus jeotgali (strain DSM 18796 / CECT 7217 / JCM 14584 / KCTC 4019 / B3) TaxID=795797 RepID=D8J2G0_HALJB|nr:deoxyribodipyrimidine photo-lyase [Halalkalicoccus jeotgali]ADJ14917.1 deoxyribodipyrimidine photo-lyase [Halalkalicoccus jeotgali B3]ELY35067.1 deoxyribodipyrimidine photolyase [Halalkalicoccus jeotgali B3]